MRIGRFGKALAFSVALHTGIAAVVPVRDTIHNVAERYEKEKKRFKVQEQRIRLSKEIQEKRRQLVLEEETRIKEGKFSFGNFIIYANALDAWEEGKYYPSKYDEFFKYVDKLIEELKISHPANAIPEVFKDLNYFGLNSRMLDVLENKGGSCEGLAHLVGSALYDAGEKEVYIRHYAADKSGYAHVTATYVEENGREHDLVSGGYSDGRGSRIHITDLVKFYSIEKGGFVYPRTADTYEGNVPTFRTLAIKPFNPNNPTSTKEATKENTQDEFKISDYPHFDTDFLFKPGDKVLQIGTDTFSLEINSFKKECGMEKRIRRTCLTSKDIELLSDWVVNIEKKLDKEPIVYNKLILYGRLLALNLTLQKYLLLSGIPTKHALVEILSIKNQKYRKEARELLKQADKGEVVHQLCNPEQEYRDLDIKYFFLLGIESFDILFEVLQRMKNTEIGKLLFFVLLSDTQTRQRAIEFAKTLTKRELFELVFDADDTNYFFEEDDEVIRLIRTKANINKRFMTNFTIEVPPVNLTFEEFYSYVKKEVKGNNLDLELEGYLVAKKGDWITITYQAGCEGNNYLKFLEDYLRYVKEKDLTKIVKENRVWDFETLKSNYDKEVARGRAGSLDCSKKIITRAKLHTLK